MAWRAKLPVSMLHLVPHPSKHIESAVLIIIVGYMQLLSCVRSLSRHMPVVQRSTCKQSCDYIVLLGHG
jgi:hypothetical protein